MRSRYSAFALGEVAYLWKTLAPEHIDRKRTESRVLAELRESTRTQHFMGLHIEAVSEEGDSATVTFFARVFRSGKDRSFRETSLFRRVDGEWRYVKVSS